jgi:prophage antirepressor-like protein
MIEEIKNDNNCIVKAFENNPISIITEDIDNKKLYCFKASDIGKALNIVNIRTSIMNFDEDEQVVRKAYDLRGCEQDTIFLTSQGVYRLLYNSKKEIAKKFRKWAGNILDDIIFNESKELKRQLEEKDKLHKIELKEKEQLLIEQKEQIEQLENKPETNGFDNRVSGYIYLVHDTIKPGHYKLGFATNFNSRLSGLNNSSSTKSIKLICKFETFDKDFAEKCIHYALNPFRINIIHKNEWFYIKNDFELAYVINTMKNVINFIKQFDIKDYESFKKLNINIKEEFKLIELEEKSQEEIKEVKDENRKITNKTIGEQKSNCTGNFKGTTFIDEKQQWKAEVQHNYKRYHLGYYQDEIDAAKVYNDYIKFLNETEGTNFLLNVIPGYITVAWDVYENNKKEISDKKSSKYNGVSFDKKKKYYVAGIQCGGKTHNLGNNINEIECAKLYNQQALFFNNTLKTNYILNEIENYITIPKDISTELIEKKKNKKSSKYYGVSITGNQWECGYTLNRKKYRIGRFNTELEAAKAYNNVIIEMNKKGCNYKVNTIIEIVF